MKEEYTEIYRSKCDNIENIVFKDNTISVPLFLVESNYYFPPSLEKITKSAYVGGDAVKAMMAVVKQYEEKRNAN